MSLQPKEVNGFEPFARASTVVGKRRQIAVLAPVEGDDDVLLTLARTIYSARRRRAKAFAAHALVFHEPPWDMLLDLYVARREQRTVSATSACLAADVPITSGLRWISTLREHGLVDISADPTDGRRTIIRLSDSGNATMECYLESVQEAV